ncbi:MAG: hypothetical protein ACOCWA_06615 [Bacteroidota bacterium]
MKKQHQIKIMKISMVFMVAMLFAGCQEEYIEIIEPDKNAAFAAGDTLSDLILKVTLKDGSFDNFIDNCSAISIKFPYSVKIRSENISIASMEDIENLAEEYSEFRNPILINYPVTIIHSDYTESVLSNRGELRKIQNQCNTGIEDEDIECIDFVYPIELSIYNKEFQKPDFVIAGNDKEFHGILKNAKDLIVEIAYPLNIELWDGTIISIQNNKELKDEIMSVMGSCDEDDEVESGDTDNAYINLLISGEWKVTFFADTTDETTSFNSFHFDFGENFTILAYSPSDTIMGFWEYEIDDNMKFLEMEFYTDEKPLVLLNDEWEMLNSNSEAILMQTESDFDGYIKKLELSKLN